MHPSSILPAYASTNFAPIKPLLDAKEKDTLVRNYLSDALRDKYKQLMDIDKPTWREIVSAGQLVALFIQGKQTLMYNPFAQTYVPVTVKGSEQLKAKGGVNIMQFYSTKHTQQWLSSSPDIEVVPCGDDDRIIAAAKAADIILDSYERRFYTHSFSLQEAILIQCFGTGINRIRFDNERKGTKVLKDIIGEEEFEMGDGFGACEDCGVSGSASMFRMEQVAENVSMPKCPECGSMGVTYEAPPKQILPVVKGQEQAEHGDLRIDIVAVPQCRWDLSSSFEESSWAVVEQVTNIGAVERLLGGKMRMHEAESENQFALDIMEQITQSGSTVGGSSFTGAKSDKTKNKMKVVTTEMFLSPDDYADIRLKGEEETVGGQKLPANARLIEIFPEGLCVVGINGLSVITGIYGEKHCDQFASGVYHVKPLTGAGKGLTDMVETQKRLNKLDTQNLEYMQSTATPAVLYAKGAVSGNEMKYLGHPKANIPIDLSKFPEVSSLQQVVYPLPAQNAGAQFFEYTYNTLNNFMQLQSHVTEFSGGLPNVNNSTATGAQISAALAQSLFAPLLAGKCDIRLGNAKNVIALFKKHFPQPKFFAERFKGQHRTSKGKWLAGADCEADFEYHIIKDSEAPKNLFTKRQELLEMFGGIFGGFEAFMMAKQSVPDEVNAILRLYDVDLESENFDETGEICRARLESAKEVFGQMAEGLMQTFGEQGMQMFDPTVVVDSCEPPIDVFELHQDKKITWFRQFLDTDEGREMPREMRAVIGAFIGRHFGNIQMEQQALAAAAGQSQMAQNGPMMEAEAQNQQMMAEQEMATGQAQGEQDIAMQDAKNQQALGQKQAELDMEAQKASLDSQKELEKQALNVASQQMQAEANLEKQAAKGASRINSVTIG